MWEERAKEVEEVYGGRVDWEERFYECPDCGDLVYECDWSEEDFDKSICPICGWSGEEEDKEFEVIISVAYTVSARNAEQAKEFASEMFMNNINCSDFDIDVV
jgi:predicted RNA-binding Zn-ribbon protein involved in translation (DUF1610 family)